MPPCSRAMRSTIASPRPAPDGTVGARARRRRPRERLLQPLARRPAAMPGPRSATSSTARPSAPRGGDLHRRRAVRERVVDEVAAQARQAPSAAAASRRHGAGREAHVLAELRVAVDDRRDQRRPGRARSSSLVASSRANSRNWPMMRSISSMSATMPARMSSPRAHLDAEAQAGERRAQVVRDAGQQHRAIALDLPQVAEHRVEAAIDRGDLGGSGLRQRRRRLAAPDLVDGRVELRAAAARGSARTRTPRPAAARGSPSTQVSARVGHSSGSRRGGSGKPIQ